MTEREFEAAQEQAAYDRQDEDHDAWRDAQVEFPAGEFFQDARVASDMRDFDLAVAARTVA